MSFPGTLGLMLSFMIGSNSYRCIHRIWRGNIMKKILKNSLFIGEALLGFGSIGASGMIVKAADTSSTTPDPPTTTSATATLTPGTITIKSAPSITFGTVASSADDTNYTSTAFTSPLAVANQGQETGWTVTLAESGFSSTVSGQPSLTGAKLTMGNSTKAPTVAAADADNTSTAPILTSPLAITNSPATIFKAGAGQGIGTFAATYGSGDANLYVPAGDGGGSYTSTLTWTLSNAPS
ncbi:hypothetical protein CBP76_12260 [Companilactobacillus nuruki]|uniref:WxL domain-containing protein n=2 Tax=Companilactobacillus nuruki TaxID=1993540 RepID=A0A2N7AR96_9LACO|nr:hypothetical protein CBP76_12260 [Companilactobacillus nuruki]